MAYYPPDTSETRDPLVVTTVFAILALISCVARACSAKQRTENLQMQELCIFIAMFLTFVSLGIQWACVVRGGTGRHITDVDPLDAVVTLKLILPFEALYGITLMFAKWSILLFYQRLFGSRRWLKICVQVTIVVMFLWMVSVILETFLLCRPLAYNWDTSIGGTCGDRNAVYVVAGATNMATDFMVLLIPVPAIWDLKMPTFQRVGLMATFSLGIFVTAISIIRLVSLMNISFTDPTWTLPMGLLWTVLEPELAILVANFPLMRPYLAELLPKKWSKFPSSWRSRKGYHDQFERLPADRQVPLQTIGGHWVHSEGGTGHNIPRSTQTPVSDESDSQKGIVQDVESGIKVQTKWTVSVSRE